MENEEKENSVPQFRPLTEEEVIQLAEDLAQIKATLLKNNRKLRVALFINKLKIAVITLWFYATIIPKSIIFIPGSVLFSIMTVFLNLKTYQEAKNRQEMRDVGFKLITSQSDFKIKIMLLGLLFYLVLYILIF